MRQFQRAMGTIDRRLTEAEVDILRIVGFCIDTLLRPETHNERAPIVEKLVSNLRDNGLTTALELLARKSRIFSVRGLDSDLETEFLKWVVVDLKQVDPQFARLDLQVLKQELASLRPDDLTSVARALATLAQASGALDFDIPGAPEQTKRKKLMARIRAARDDRERRALQRDLSDLLPTFEGRGTAIDDVDREYEVAVTDTLPSANPEPS